jgi:hypothetical protein
LQNEWRLFFSLAFGRIGSGSKYSRISFAAESFRLPELLAMHGSPWVNLPMVTLNFILRRPKKISDNP